jgi:hypothetical protein
VNMTPQQNEAGDVTGYLFAPKDPELTEFEFRVKIPPEGLLQGTASGSAQGIVAVAGHFSSSADFSFKNVTWPEDFPPNWQLDSGYGAHHEAKITVILNSEDENAEPSAELELDGEGSIQTLDWSSHQRRIAEEEEQSAWEKFSHPDGVGRVQALDNPPVVSFSILSVELTAHRPQTEGPGYGSPFQKYEIPDDKEESPGAGIRVNGDTESAAAENDLIEVELEVAPFPVSSGVTYVLKRNNSNIKVWDSRDMTGSCLLDSAEEEITISSSPMTVWVENPSGGDADLELVARSGSTDVCSDKIHFYPFTSVVVFFEGEGRNPHDPPVTGNSIQDLKGVGISTMALELYLEGYDVHIYTDSPSSVGFNEVKSAVTERDVSQVALVGYSHGGGSVYEVSYDMYQDTTSFDLKYTAYIDAMRQPFTGITAEDRRPLNSPFHVNYFQNGEAIYLYLDGAPCLPAGPGIEANIDTPSSPETHVSIDDNATVINSIITNLKAKLPQP